MGIPCDALPFPDAERDACAQPKIILVGVDTVLLARIDIVRFHGSNREVSAYPQIDPETAHRGSMAGALAVERVVGEDLRPAAETLGVVGETVVGPQRIPRPEDVVEEAEPLSVTVHVLFVASREVSDPAPVRMERKHKLRPAALEPEAAANLGRGVGQRGLVGQPQLKDRHLARIEAVL